MKWTEERVALAVARHIFDWKRHIVVPNLAWGMGFDFEIDLGILSAANWLTEVEIKVSLSDLRADEKKWRHQRVASHGPQYAAATIRKRYIAMPLELWDKRYHGGMGLPFPTLPEGTGEIAVYGSARGDAAKIQKPAKPNPAARKLTAEERDKMLRLGYLRFWSRREASAIAMAGLTRALEEHIASTPPPDLPELDD